MTGMAGWVVEYRAVFGDPHGNRSYGEFCGSVMGAMATQPDRPEETLREVVGVQARKVEPWLDVPLDNLLKWLNEGSAATAPAVRAGSATCANPSCGHLLTQHGSEGSCLVGSCVCGGFSLPRAVRDEPQA